MKARQLRAHARRDFSDGIKAIGKGNQKALKESVAYKVLIRISAIYKLEDALQKFPPEERLKERQTSIKPLVEEYFAWVKETLENKTLLPKGKAADDLHYASAKYQWGQIQNYPSPL
ncbi:MAG: transposase [Lachnospiraceae bacterium]|nr:transposase [Lachnospiraceae bacterium]